VHDYQKNGITGNEPGTTLTVTNSNVVGQGATNGAAENGIQIGFGAHGTLTGNSVIDDIWAPDTVNDPGDAAAGILLYGAASSSVTVKYNFVGNTQFGIALVTDTMGQDDWVKMMEKSSSAIEFSKPAFFDAIDVCSNGNTIQTNTVTNSGESAIHLDASCGVQDGGSSGDNNVVTGNILCDANVGLLNDSGVSGNTLTPNMYYTSVIADPVGSVRAHLPYKPARP
jgi:nitrous oxidase accessory protein NosD